MVRGWKTIVPMAAAILLAVVFRAQLRLIAVLLTGGALIAYLIEPLAGRIAKRIGRGVGVVVSLALTLLVLTGLAFLIVPLAVGQFREFIRIAPALWGLFGGMLPVADWTAALIGGTASFAGTIGEIVTMLTLGVFLAIDRDRMLVTLELLIPYSARKLTLRMAGAVNRELKTYLRGQLVVSVIVGAISAVGFMLIGLPSWLLLGLCVAIFNLIPYFGPFIGGAPAVLLALQQGLSKALLACLVTAAVQQLDGMWISPRVLSGVTGLSPASVLLAIAVGGSMAGLGGMLLALPALICLKVCLRVWAGRRDFPDSS